jgi:pyruvate-formate lyase|tara:strand:+ start:46 stop:225 length:180 start_codon:yes stop_codon:yes gene_type:complete
MTIGYDTVNNCITVVRTPENTSYEYMIEICINKLIKGKEVEKYKTILINMAKAMDQANI